ncbi:MAG: glycosyl hydrolase 53 family protein [Nibricoccus sp.]
MKIRILPRLLAASLIALASAVSASATIWIKGADCSSLRKSEDKGGKYYYSSGAQADALKILRDAGCNTVRIRVWIGSPDGYHGKTQLLQIAKRAKALGQEILVDFHYSYTWTDPGKQNKPTAWTSYTLSQLNTAVYNHTYEICKALVDQGTPAAYVQIGNEINDGMLWSTGRISTNGNSFANLAQLLRSGSNGAWAAYANTKIVLHIAKGGDWELIKWWFDGVKAQGIWWDYTAVSYYPYWHGSLSGLQSALNNAASRYGKPVLVAECAYPWTLAAGDSMANNIGLSSQLVSGYPATVTGQTSMINAIKSVLNAVPNNRGAGFLYWDATWTPVTGNGWDNTNSSSGNNWENQALFDFSGKALASQVSIFK